MYEVRADLAGQRNLEDARPDVVESLRSRLFSWSLEDPALMVRGGHLIARDESIAAKCAPEN